MQPRPSLAGAVHIFENSDQGAVALFFMVTGALFYGKIAGGFWTVNHLA
jgi:hypothetical protein